MEKEPRASKVLADKGINFSFPNLKNLSNSDITYPEFLGCVAQRLLLKQYAAQVIDTSNILCPTSRTSEIFDKTKEGFSKGLNNLFLKKSTLSVINAQSSKNKINKEVQTAAAIEFVKWYDEYWFNSLKSERFLTSLCQLFEDASIGDVKEESNDWKVLAKLYATVDPGSMLNDIGIDSKVFINTSSNITPVWFDNILSSLVDFIDMGTKKELPEFSSLVDNEELLLPTMSAYMESTIIGIEDIETGKKSYGAPLDPYNMFRTFGGTSMGQLLKLNQMVFTLYNYMKILV